MSRSSGTAAQPAVRCVPHPPGSGPGPFGAGGFECSELRLSSNLARCVHAHARALVAVYLIYAGRVTGTKKLEQSELDLNINAGQVGQENNDFKTWAQQMEKEQRACGRAELSVRAG